MMENFVMIRAASVVEDSDIEREIASEDYEDSDDDVDGRGEEKTAMISRNSSFAQLPRRTSDLFQRTTSEMRRTSEAALKLLSALPQKQQQQQQQRPTKLVNGSSAPGLPIMHETQQVFPPV